MPDSPAELAAVVQALRALFNRIEAVLERERAFTGYVSHELRTPLAGLRSTLEVALGRQGRSEADYREAISDSLAIVGQQQELVDSLLRLRKIESGAMPVQRVAVSLSDLHRRVETDLSGMILAAKVPVSVAIPVGIEILTDPEVYLILHRNLLGNAVVHGVTGDEVSVVAEEETGGAVRLRFTNACQPVTAESIDKLFEPFWRGDRARSSTGGHHGLGLAISRGVAGLLGLDLRLSMPEPGRFVAEVHFPPERIAGSDGKGAPGTDT